MQCRTIQPTESGEGFHARRDFHQGIGVDGAGTTFVPSVERGEQIHHFRPTYLTDNDAVRPHTQSLFQQVRHGDLTLTFHIVGAGDQVHHMRVGRVQLRGVFDADDAFVVPDGSQHGAQQRGFPAASTAHHQEGFLRFHNPCEGVSNISRHGAAIHQAIKRGHCLAKHTQRQAGTTIRWRAEQGVNTNATVVIPAETTIGKGLRIIQTPATRHSEPGSQLADLIIRIETQARLLQTLPPIKPNTVRPVDHHVRHPLYCQHLLQNPSPRRIVAKFT